MKAKLCWSFCLVVLCCNSGCNQPPAPETIPSKSSRQFSAALYLEFFSQSAAVQSQLLIEQTKILHDNVTDFLAKPESGTLNSVQQAWLDAHRSFLKANFYLSATASRSPAEGTGFSTAMIDAWPIQEGFLDSLQHYPTSGIINDLTIPIDAPTLRNQHGITDSEEVSLGFHALEFLLWARPITDFSEQNQLSADQSSDGLSLDQLSNNRRRETLRLISRLLYEDIISQLSPPPGDDHQQQPSATSVQGAIQACSIALQSVQRELLLNPGDDESSGHSRFSQSSVQDLLTYTQTLTYVYADPDHPEAGRPDAGRLQRLFESLDPILADQFSRMLSATLQSLSELTDSTIDRSTLLKLNSRLELMIDHSQQFEILIRP